VNDQIENLRSALFDESLDGIRKTGEVYPLGAYLLVGAMIDMLAGLWRAPERDNDGKQRDRYIGFVHEFFPARYAEMEMGPKLWGDLRCRPLHNFSAEGVMFADSQRGDNIHLRPDRERGRVLLHWPEFLADYTGALERYWAALESDSAIRANAERRCKLYPPMMVIDVQIPATLPLTIPFTIGAQGASAYGS
jgi:hypothetical protein